MFVVHLAQDKFVPYYAGAEARKRHAWARVPCVHSSAGVVQICVFLRLDEEASSDIIGNSQSTDTPSLCMKAPTIADDQLNHRTLMSITPPFA